MGLKSASVGRRVAQCVLSVAALLSAAAASAVQVSLPSNATISAVGQTTIVPVSIADTTGVTGIAINFTYDSTIATATLVAAGPTTAGGMPPPPAACSIVPSIATPGVVTITAACTQGLVGASGVLFNVTFLGNQVGVTNLTFTATQTIPNGCQLNEGTPSCEPSDGQLSVLGPTNTPTDTPTNTPTNTLTNTPTDTPTRTPTATPTDTNTVGPSPTATHSGTVTSTATNTPTNTPTNTATNTPTNSPTRTPTNTPTSTPTATNTGTVTQTRTVTNTREATATRAAIPLVPSPISPAGAAMILALGAGLFWTLRRMARFA